MDRSNSSSGYMNPGDDIDDCVCVCVELTGIHNVCDRSALCGVPHVDVVVDDRHHGLCLGSSAAVHWSNATHSQRSVTWLLSLYTFSH